MASEHQQGEQAAAGIFLICAAVGVLWTYRAVTIPLAIAVTVVIVWRWLRQRRRVAAEKAAMVTGFHAAMLGLYRLRGAEYLQLFAGALRYLATGKSPTFAGFERDLGMSHSEAKSVMADLQEQGYVTPPLGSKRRIARDSATLTASADIADGITALPDSA